MSDTPPGIACRYCAGFGAVTVIIGFSLRKLFSPTPRTFIKSSTFLNPPSFWRYSMIRSAVLAPMNEDSSISTNGVSQWTLAAAENLQLVGDALEAAGAKYVNLSPGRPAR